MYDQTPFDQPLPSPPRQSRVKRFFVRLMWGIIAIVVVAGAGFAAGRFTAPKANASAHPQSTGTIAGAGNGNSGAGPGPEPSPTDSNADQSPVPPANNSGTVLLVNLTPTTGDFQSDDSNPVIDGVAQQFAIAQDLDGEDDSGDLGYNLGRHYLHFTGVLGIDDNSSESHIAPEVEIQGDGVKLATYFPTLGHPDQINLNVKGILRLDIVWSSKTSDNTYSTIATMVVGDGQLTPVPGYAPSPTSSPTD